MLRLPDGTKQQAAERAIRHRGRLALQTQESAEQRMLQAEQVIQQAKQMMQQAEQGEQQAFERGKQQAEAGDWSLLKGLCQLTDAACRKVWCGLPAATKMTLWDALARPLTEWPSTETKQTSQTHPAQPCTAQRVEKMPDVAQRARSFVNSVRPQLEDVLLERSFAEPGGFFKKRKTSIRTERQVYHAISDEIFYPVNEALELLEIPLILEEAGAHSEVLLACTAWAGTKPLPCCFVPAATITALCVADPSSSASCHWVHFMLPRPMQAPRCLQTMRIQSALLTWWAGRRPLAKMAVRGVSCPSRPGESGRNAMRASTLPISSAAQRRSKNGSSMSVRRPWATR